MRGHTWISCLTLLTFLGGCTDITSSHESLPQAKSVLAEAFDPAMTGTIRGRVCWDGEIPTVEATVARAIAYHPSLHKNPVHYKTPHIPQVHLENRGVKDAVIFLRGVDPRLAKPWNHEAVRVEFRDRQLLLYQGNQQTNAGFVQRGDKVEAINRDADYHALRGRGAAFFTLPLLKADTVSAQPLPQSGLVELFDAGGYYWLHAHLFVAEHPYYVRTDADGAFTLEQVPAGKYEIVGWLPSWVVTRKEIDPETAILVRQVWAAPLEQKQLVEVQTGPMPDITFHWSEEMFSR